ncbi:MAG TPA: glutamyl-tRNA reductase [Acidimicrobiia bacterium]
MSVIVVGLNHRTVPVGLLERMAVPESRLTKVLHDLAGREHLLEVAVLSTCNRTEIYAYCSRFHAAVGDVVEFLSEYSGATPEEFNDHLYSYYDEAAVSHLFGVAAGLDSMIVGESEILGQVRDAWQAAHAEKVSATLLGRVFRQAVEVGKRVRTETEIGRHPVSVSSAAVAVASEHLGGFEGCRVLVIGAGEMGEGMTVAIAARGVDDICVVNRTAERGAALATRVSGRVGTFDDLETELTGADVVLASTGATDIILDRETVERIMAARPDRPLMVVDVGMPRDVDAGVGEIPAVRLLDLDDLKDYAQRSTERRRAEIGKAREILATQVERFREERAERLVAPLVTALRRRANEVRTAELERHRAKLATLDPETVALIESITKGVTNKLLHDPTVQVKQAAGTERGELLADSLTTLFDLDTQSDRDS